MEPEGSLPQIKNRKKNLSWTQCEQPIDTIWVRGSSYFWSRFLFLSLLVNLILNSHFFFVITFEQDIFLGTYINKYIDRWFQVTGNSSI
jgi:hypothetical protein